jgi:hypothetical protein
MRISGRRVSTLGQRLQKLEKVNDYDPFRDYPGKVSRIARKNVSPEDRRLLPEAMALHEQNVVLPDSHQAVLDRWVEIVQEAENEVLLPWGMHRDDIDWNSITPLSVYKEIWNKKSRRGSPGGGLESFTP